MSRWPQRTIEQRFWSKVDRRADDECWPWTGAVNSQGRGSFGTVGKKTATASRLAWELTNGPAGSGHVCHRCDNPLCCNPAHLFLGSHADNMRDMALKGRGRQGATKLTEAKVTEILLLKGQMTRPAIARRFSIDRSVISRIHNGQAWKHVSRRAANVSS